MSAHKTSILVLVENKIILIAMIAMVVMVPSACAGASIMDHNCTDLSQIPDGWSDNGASGIYLDDRGTPGCAEQGVQVICSAGNNGDCIDEQAHRATCTEAILDDRVVIKKKFFFEDPVVGKGIDGYDMIRVPDLENYGNPGMPVLPFKTVKILIPHGEDVKDIDIVAGNKVVLKGFFNIECGQTPVPISSKAKAVKTMPDQTIYASMHPFPTNLYSQVSIQELRGYRILILNLYPVQYAPEIGEISYFEEMKVIVTTTTPVSILSTAKTTFRGLPHDKARVLDVIDNPVEVDTYSTGTKTTGVRSTSIVDSADSYDYVIITNSALESAFQPLVDWKNKKGVSTTIVTVDQITSDPSYNGVDTQEEIRNFIIDAYSNWAIEYVLLGGDADYADVGGESGDDIIPVRRFWAMSYDGDDGDLIPADMYYSNLDGTFDYDNDGIYGEPGDGESGGEVDLYSEVFIGRAPVDSVEEVSNFVNKTIAYENLSGTENYLKKTLMVGEWLLESWNGSDVWGGDYKDEIKNDITPPWTTSTLYDRDYLGNKWPKSEIITRINQGQHIINHLGHSSTLYVMKLCNAPINQLGIHCGTSGNTDVDDLTNDKYPLIYSQGCYAGSFDNWHYSRTIDEGGYTKSDSIAEHFVTSEHGAFAVIMNSRYGFVGASQYFDREFFDALFNENIRNLGRALQDSKADNAGLVVSSPYESYMRWCYYEINLLGDPETSIHEPLPEPHDISLTHMEAPNSVKLNEIAIINITANNIGQNDENNIEIEFLVDGIIEDTQTITTLNSGSSQKLSFSWSTEVNDDYSITIYAVPVAGEVVTSNNIVQTDISMISAEILLVDDDEGSNYETYYSSALDYYGYPHVIWNVSSHGSPYASDLQSYKIVIWLTGDDYSTTLTAADQTNLQTFLDGGGKLFLSGQDIGYSIGNTSFYQNYLHANYIHDNVGIYALIGVSGDPITSYINVSIFSGDGANNQNFPSEISPSDAYAEPIFYYEGDGTGALRIDTGTYRVVYFAFGFEAINDQWDRAYLMYRIINWLDIEPPGIYVSDHGATYVPAGNPVTINAYVYDQSDISSVYAEIESPDENVIATIQLFDDGMYYDGSADDGIFGNSWTTHPEEKDYYIDFIANDIWGNSGKYNNKDRFTTVPFSATSDILLVDDSTYTSYIHYYEDALNLNGYSYNLWDPDLRGEIDSTINSFKLCIWSAPYGGPSSTEQSVLREFLDNAGRLFISGQDIGYSIGDTPFYQNYLHANYTQDDVNLYSLNGVYGDPITGGINISIAGGDGANNQWYPSEIDPFAPAESIFYYNTASSLSKENLPLIELPATPKDLGKTLEYNTTGISSSGTGALRVDTGAYRIVYFAFGFEAINSASDRDTVMDRIITWFTQNDNTANDNVVTIENVTLQPGTTQDVPIRLLNSTGVGGGTVTLTFDQSIVIVMSAVAGDFDSIFTPDYSNVSDGVLRVTCTKSGQDLTGDLTLATIPLAAVGTSGYCELGLYAELTDANGDNVPSRTVNGTFTINDGTSGDVGVTDVVERIEIRGTMQELSSAAFAGYTWNAQSFTSFWYDAEKDTTSETLTVQALGAGVNTIPTCGLTYTAVMQGTEYRNPSLNIAGDDYMVTGWFGEKCMAVNNQPNVLSKIIREMEDTDKKTLATGDSWDIGNGYTLIAKQIDLDGNKVWLSLEKNGTEVESSVIHTGATPSGDSFTGMDGVTRTTTDTFVYQPDIGSESDVPIFTVSITAVFRGTDCNLTQLKYVMLIDDELLKIENDYESHNMKVTDITATSIVMQNDGVMTLTEDSDIKVMGDIVFHVAKDDDGDASQEYRFYPRVEYTDPGTYEIRGTMAEIVPAGLAITMWNAQSFAGFWYDIEKDTSSETLVLDALGAGINTIPKQTGPGTGLTYTATMQGAEYKNPSLNIVGNDYMIMGWFAKKYTAVNNQPDVLSKITLEMADTDKKTLATGESWDLGNGYTLIAKQIDLDGIKVWLSLEKNGVEVESSIIDTGATPSRSTFVDINGNDVLTTDTFVYQPDIGSESDVPIFTVAVTEIFRGADVDHVQLKYAMLIDDDLLNIESDYESHKMKVTDITATSIAMQNDEDMTLTEDSDVEIMGDIVFHVAKDDDGDATTEYRFYPMVKRIICGVAVAKGFYDASISQPTNRTTELSVNTTYTLAVTNTGNFTGTFALEVTNYDGADVAALNETEIVNLAIGASQNVTLNVTDADGGRYNVTVNVISTDSGSEVASTGYIMTTVVDTTPPASITGLDNLTTEQSHIKWVWNDPTDADFAKVMIYLNGAFETNVSMGAQNYNATGLDPDTEYTISTHTVDEPGNVNQTWMNDTVRTKPAPQLHHINVTPTSGTMIITESMNFTATGFDQNNAEISGLVFTWNRSDAYIENFTTINDTTVNFTAEHVGITYITAKNGGVTSEQVQVTVNDATNSMNATGIKVFATTSGDASVTGEFDNNLTGWINITAIGNATSSAEVNQSDPRYGLGSGDKVVSGVIINVGGDSNIRSELAAGNGTIRIWICYDETTLAAMGIDASTLAIWKYDNTTGEWKKQPSTISKTCVYADVNHLCTFGLVGSKAIGSSNDGTSTYQSNGGGGGGGGGGASGEAYANIALRERVERQIMKNRFVTYRFVKPGTDITFVNFTAMNNYGSVATVVETLHNTSTLVAAAPPGTVYKNINLWVGSAGFATEKNMENVTVSFRVNRSWIDENSVSISTIRLHGYNKSGKTWAPLPVEITGKDELDIHFKSKTTIFNQLAITCPAPVSNPRSAPMSTASLAGTGTQVPEEASPAPFNATSSQTGTGTEAPAASASSSSIPGPGVVAVVVAVGSAAWLAWKKRRR